ncbi:hypothetical protein BKH43_02465 [Helicobacter sp. 13S00401-1]|uniref:hypothetical protein n=1 Tax=Helicobacter sp. 13S00401-1 TaxID=1905758 RepID=UPI000BA57E3A|nr:hypothetical protein [Helicobacter sp. 13S00401-1]PAF51089.1 hypothetical protein BKH43_02465 [Helicobacter sp. 13S00401-1]
MTAKERLELENSQAYKDYKEDFLKRYPTKESYYTALSEDLKAYKEGKLETYTLEEVFDGIEKMFERLDGESNISSKI